MRMSELSAASGVPAATIKFYVRSGLLPEGERTSATRSNYSETHVARLRVIRALIDAGVSVAQARTVVNALDDPPPTAADLLGVAHAAVAPEAGSEVDPARARALIEQMGWDPDRAAPDRVADLAQALDALQRVGFELPPEVLSAYVESTRSIALTELDGVPQDSAEEAVRYVVLGTALTEPLILALRRLAEQLVAADRFGDRADLDQP